MQITTPLANTNIVIRPFQPADADEFVRSARINQDGRHLDELVLPLIYSGQRAGVVFQLRSGSRGGTRL